jgi:outer membrane protein assembly factor BamB
VPVVRSSDVATTEIRVAPDNPPTPPLAPLPASVRLLWTVPSTATGGPVEGPTAVATGTDRVAGLDPATGRERWSYRRGNARLCDSTLRDGLVLALFAKSHGCRDLIGLDAVTGARRWTRTVELTTDAVLSSGPGVAVVTGAGTMVAVELGGGLNRWTYTAAGCTLDPAVAGPAAVATVAHCGGEDRLVIHDMSADRRPWVSARPTGSRPRVAAVVEEEVAVLSSAGGAPALTGYLLRTAGDEQEATRAGSVRDPRLAYSAAGPLASATAGQVVVLWTGQQMVAVNQGARRVLWAAAASGPPAVVDGRVFVADAGSFTARPVLTGTPVTRVAVIGGRPPDAAALTPIGRFVVTAGAGRLAAYG